MQLESEEKLHADASNPGASERILFDPSSPYKIMP